MGLFIIYILISIFCFIFAMLGIYFSIKASNLYSDYHYDHVDDEDFHTKRSYLIYTINKKLSENYMLSVDFENLGVDLSGDEISMKSLFNAIPLILFVSIIPVLNLLFSLYFYKSNLMVYKLFKDLENIYI